MIRYMHCTRSLSKKLASFRKAGKKGELAADQCEMLLNAFRSNSINNEAVYNKRTKNGEGRLDNCVKYNLGNGYRMITVREGERLFVPFVGSHDDASLWLERHKYFVFSDMITSFDCEEIDNENDEMDEDFDMREQTCQESDIYEEYIKSMLNESILREIFSGLCR